jgi:hypothetical protein
MTALRKTPKFKVTARPSAHRHASSGLPADEVELAGPNRVRSRLVWGFSCQAIVFGFSSQFFVRSGKGRSSFFNRAAGVKRVCPLSA